MAQSKHTSRGVTNSSSLLPPAPSTHKSKASSAGVCTGTASSAGSDNHSGPASTTRIRTSVYALDNSSDDQLCKRGLCFALHSSASAQVKATLKTTAPENMDCREFGRLPSVVQRKYFSSTERLHYYQQSSVTTTVSLPSSRHARNRSTGRISLRQSTETFPGRSSHVRPAKLRKHRNSESSAKSPVDEQWLLDRQESLRKKLLAAEQRAALAEKHKADIATTDTETTTDDMQRTRPDSSASFSSKESVLDLERKDTFDTDIMKAREAARMSFRWMDEDGELDLRLCHFDSLEQGNNLSASARTRSSILARRTLSLTAKSREFFNNRPNLAPIRIVESDPDDMLPPLTFEPGSPLNLDIATPTVRSVHEPELETDPESVPLPESPKEPKDIPLPNSRPTTANLLPLKCKPIVDGSSGLFIHTPHGHREVTLRMTLTRKDLRDNDSILEENVTLEELKPSELTTIDWDALDKESSTGLKKLWRKVKKT